MGGSHERLSELYAAHCSRAFPKIGAEIGSFVVYDADIAGLASRAAKGEAISAASLPEPDRETTDFFRRLRGGANLSEEETEFLNYCVQLEHLRETISDEPVPIYVPLLDEGVDVWVVAKAMRVGPRAFRITAFSADLEAQGAKPAFGVGTTVDVSGGHPVLRDGAVIEITKRIATGVLN